MPTGRAFGLDLAGPLDAPGLLDGGADAESAPRTVLEPIARPDLEQRWEGGRRICELPLAGGPALAIDHAPGAGYLLQVAGWGAYLISDAGDRVSLAAPDVEPWRWQRLLTAQVLPLAALLRGRELLHASAVRIDGRAIAITGASEAGKTTLAAHLAVRGAVFMTDDAHALTTSDEEIVAHPGPALANLRDAAAATLGVDGAERLGRELGRDAGGARLLVHRRASAAPLRALYFVERGPASDGGVRLEPVARPSLSLLASATFNSALRTPARLLNQLETCSRLARQTALFRVRVPAGCGPAAVAADLERHVGEAVAA
jgi:hypothetical protein